MLTWLIQRVIRILDGCIRVLERGVPNPCPRGIDHTVYPHCISPNRCIKARERGETLGEGR